MNKLMRYTTSITRHQSTGSWFYAVGFCVFLSFSNSIVAAEPVLASCTDTSKPLVTIGIPDDQKHLANLAIENLEAADLHPVLQDVCPVFAF